MSDYHKNLIKTLSNSEAWPEFARPDFMRTLDSAAYGAFTRQTLEGYLAAFLIYQQISEDMVRNVIKLGRLYNQAVVFPLKIEYEPIDSDRMTFGVLLKQLQSIPHEDSELSDLCRSLNALRVQLVHKITLKEDLDDIKSKCHEALRLFSKIDALYLELEDEFRIGLAHYKNIE